MPQQPSAAVFPPRQYMRNGSEPNQSVLFVAQRIHLQNTTCSLLIEAIKGKMKGLSREGSSDIQTTAAATKEDTVTCKLLCRNFFFLQLSTNIKA